MSKVIVVESVDHGLDAEQTAMLASLRSRSAEPVESLLAKVKEKGAASFMKNYYIGYGTSGVPGTLPGHGSICQSGSTNVNLEEVSMLTALAFEDHGLFNGQENSTRYLPFDKNSYVVPAVAEAHKGEAISIIEGWFALYRKVLKSVETHLLSTLTRPEDVPVGKWEKAVKCKAFDIASGYLPAATHTNVTWHTQLDNVNTQVQRLKYYPLVETRNVALECEKKLLERYPNSIKMALPEGHDEWLRRYAPMINYSEVSVSFAMTDDKDISVSGYAEKNVSWSLDRAESKETFDQTLLVSQNIEEILMTRPKYMYAPSMLKTAGMIQLHSCLDLASFRELHRHRDGYIPVPYITPESGMHSWYIESLPDDISIEIQMEVQELLDRSKELYKVAPYEGQYTLPLGIRCVIEMNWCLPQLLYFMELRSGHSCRQPIRQLAQVMAKRFMKAFPGAKLYANMEPECKVYVQRAEQDIVEVKEKAQE